MLLVIFFILTHFLLPTILLALNNFHTIKTSYQCPILVLLDENKQKQDLHFYALWKRPSLHFFSVHTNDNTTIRLGWPFSNISSMLIHPTSFLRSHYEGCHATLLSPKKSC